MTTSMSLARMRSLAGCSGLAASSAKDPAGRSHPRNRFLVFGRGR
jgi:hypothetical protein